MKKIIILLIIALILGCNFVIPFGGGGFAFAFVILIEGLGGIFFATVLLEMLGFDAVNKNTERNDIFSIETKEKVYETEKINLDTKKTLSEEVKPIIEEKYTKKAFTRITFQPDLDRFNMKTIEKDTNRDNFMSSEIALNYGLIDQIVKTR